MLQSYVAGYQGAEFTVLAFKLGQIHCKPFRANSYRGLTRDIEKEQERRYKEKKRENRTKIFRAGRSTTTKEIHKTPHP